MTVSERFEWKYTQVYIGEGVCLVIALCLPT